MRYLLIAMMILTVGGCFLSRAEQAEYAKVKARLGQYTDEAVGVLQNVIAKNIKPADAVERLFTIAENRQRDENRLIQLQDEAAKNRKYALALGLNVALAIAGFVLGCFPANSKARKGVETTETLATVIETNGTPGMKEAAAALLAGKGLKGVFDGLLDKLGFRKGTVKEEVVSDDKA